MLPNYLIVSRAKTLTQYRVQQNKSKNVITAQQTSFLIKNTGKH